MPALPEGIIDAIAANVAESYPEVTTQIVSAVIDQVAAAQVIANGDPEGMVRRSDSGDLATRIVRGGLPMWRIQPADPEENVSYDMAPTLPWPVLFTPT